MLKSIGVKVDPYGTPFVEMSQVADLAITSPQFEVAVCKELHDE